MGTGDREDERRRTPGGWANSAATAAPRQAIEALAAAGRPAAVILLALSRLDLLNAAHGRRVGDAVVKAAYHRLATLAGSSGAVSRLGGRRFALTVDADVDAAMALAGTVSEALARPYSGGAVVGSRCAVAVRTGDEGASAMLARAGEALAAAHGAEAGAPVLAEPVSAASLDALAIDLHHAIARGEIDILFQPQVRLSDGGIIGVEALARWRHPQLGSLGADELFAAAARADLTLALSEHIQTAALQQAAGWPRALEHLKLSVNITAGDVARPEFATAMLGRIAATGFSPTRLTLELTETGPVANLGATAATLRTLRDVGCSVAIDDFGAGYSSLVYIKALPVDTVKLDKTLVEDLHPGSRNALVVEAAVAMARALGLSVVAEGVEDETQRAVLAAAGCAAYQGYLCAPALDVEALAKLIAAP